MSAFKIPGTLTVRKIPSRNGPFCVGDLSTPIGEFKVKDPVLDQFKPGEYPGEFWISEIYMAPFISFGRSVIEMRARLHDLNVQAGGEEKPAKARPSEEIDPVDESPAPRASNAAGGNAAPRPKPERIVLDKRKPKPPTPAAAGSDEVPQKDTTSTQPTGKEAANAGLFDEEIAGQIERREPVRLDATVDRVLLRQQSAQLRELGYEFDFKEKVWIPKAKK